MKDTQNYMQSVSLETLNCANYIVKDLQEKNVAVNTDFVFSVLNYNWIHPTAEFNYSIFFDAVIQMNPDFPFDSIMERMIHKAEVFPYEDNSFGCFMRDFLILNKVHISPEIIYSVWPNQMAQLTWIQCSLANPMVFSFEKLCNTRVNVHPFTVKMSGTSSWMSLDFIKLLFSLAGLHSDSCFQFFDHGIARAPFHLFLGIIQAKIVSTPFSKDIINRCIVSMFSLREIAVPLIKNFWFDESQPDAKWIVPQAIAEWYTKNLEDINKVRYLVDVAEEIFILSKLFTCPCMGFVIDIAIIAGQKGLLDLPTWLEDRALKQDEIYYTALVNVLKRRFQDSLYNEFGDCSPSERVSLKHVIDFLYSKRDILDAISLETVNEFRNILMKTESDLIAQELSFVENLDSKAWSQVTLKLTELFNKILADDQGVVQAISLEPSDLKGRSFSGKFRIESHPLVDEFAKWLHSMKVSESEEDQNLYRCIVKRFTDGRSLCLLNNNELFILAHIFSSLLNHEFCADDVFSILFHFLKTPKSRLYVAATIVLVTTKKILKNWPDACRTLSGLLYFNDFPPMVRLYIEQSISNCEVDWTFTGKDNSESMYASPNCFDIVNSDVITFHPSGYFLRSDFLAFVANSNSVTSGGSGQSSTNPLLSQLDERFGGKGSGPDSQYIQPDISNTAVMNFVLNNLTKENVKQKSQILNSQFTQIEYFRWFIKYLLIPRIKEDSQFIDLYWDLISEVENDTYTQAVIEESIKSCTECLKSCISVMAGSDRMTMKNLGRWIGHITLGCNRPILRKDICLIYLLVESYFKSPKEFECVLNLVCGVLHSSVRGCLFSCRSPYVIALLGLISEIYKQPSVKNQLKLEIEALMIHLKIDISFLNSTSYLKDPKILQKMRRQLLWNEREYADLNAKHQGNSSSKRFSFNYSDLNISSHKSIQPFLRMNLNWSLYGISISYLQAMLYSAVERTISELLSPIADRVLKMCTVSCEYFLKNDFCMESDDMAVRKAAESLTRSAACAMILGQYKEVMVTQLSGNLRSLIKSSYQSNIMPLSVGSPSHRPITLDIIHESANILTNDNIDIVCAYLQKSLAERAVTEIHNKLNADYERRKKLRSEGRKFNDPSLTSYVDLLPEPLRNRCYNASKNPNFVYDEFNNLIPGFNSTGKTFQIDPHTSRAVPCIHSGNIVYPDLPDVPKSLGNDVIAHLQKALTEIEHVMQRLSALSCHINSLQRLHDVCTHVIKSADGIILLRLIKNCVGGIFESMNNKVYVADTDVHLTIRECHLLFLLHLKECKSLPVCWISKFVTRYVMELPLELKLNIEAIRLFVTSDVFHMKDFDQDLVQLMDSSSNVTILNFAMNFCRTFLVEEKEKLVMDYDLSGTLNGLVRVINSGVSSFTYDRIFISDALGVSLPLQSGLKPNAQFPNYPFSSLLNPKCHEVTDINPVVNSIITAGTTSTVSSIDGSSGSTTATATTLSPASSLAEGLAQCAAGTNLFTTDQAFSTIVYALIKDWHRFYFTASGLDHEKNFVHFLKMMAQQNILCADESYYRFFKVALEFVINTSYNYINAIEIHPSFIFLIESYASIIILSFKNLPSSSKNNKMAKINHFSRIVNMLGSLLLSDLTVRAVRFHSFPYYRLVKSLLYELDRPESELDSLRIHLLSCIAGLLHNVRPEVAPQFVFYWLKLVSHRFFLSKLLMDSDSKRPSKSWIVYHTLLIDFFKFLSLVIKPPVVPDCVKQLFKGCSKLLLVLLHDFPVFLAEYHFAFCDVLPRHCYQLRNYILSAFSRDINYSDPISGSFNHPECYKHPRILTNVAAHIVPFSFKSSLDNYMQGTNQPDSFLPSVLNFLLPTSSSNDKNVSQYNISLINALVLYVGIDCINTLFSKHTANLPQVTQSVLANLTASDSQMKNSGYNNSNSSATGNASTGSGVGCGKTKDGKSVITAEEIINYKTHVIITTSNIMEYPHYELFFHISNCFDQQGLYILFTAMANQLRYPNTHTRYFACLLLVLFKESSSAIAKETISRVLLERLISFRPHPWGVMKTLAELIRNPEYGFWKHEFVRQSSKIEKVFKSILKRIHACENEQHASA